MGLTTVNVTVEEKTYAFAQGLAKFGADLVAAVKQGQGTVPEVAAIIEAAVADLAPVAMDMGAIPSEMKDDKFAFAKAWELAGTDFVKGVLG